MDRISIPERLDPSSRVGDAESDDRLGKKLQNRRKRVKPKASVTPEESTEEKDESRQLDELA